MNGSTLVELYGKLYQALIGLWNFFSMPFYDALLEYQDRVPLLGPIWRWFAELVGNVTGISSWLNQFNLITFMLGAGVVSIIIIWVVKFLGDAIGL